MSDNKTMLLVGGGLLAVGLVAYMATKTGKDKENEEVTISDIDNLSWNITTGQRKLVKKGDIIEVEVTFEAQGVSPSFRTSLELTQYYTRSPIEGQWVKVPATTSLKTQTVVIRQVIPGDWGGFWYNGATVALGLQLNGEKGNVLYEREAFVLSDKEETEIPSEVAKLIEWNPPTREGVVAGQKIYIDVMWSRVGGQVNFNPPRFRLDLKKDGFGETWNEGGSEGPDGNHTLLISGKAGRWVEGSMDEPRTTLVRTVPTSWKERERLVHAKLVIANLEGTIIEQPEAYVLWNFTVSENIKWSPPFHEGVVAGGLIMVEVDWSSLAGQPNFNPPNFRLDLKKSGWFETYNEAGSKGADGSHILKIPGKAGLWTTGNVDYPITNIFRTIPTDWKEHGPVVDLQLVIANLEGEIFEKKEAYVLWN